MTTRLSRADAGEDGDEADISGADMANKSLSRYGEWTRCRELENDDEADHVLADGVVNEIPQVVRVEQHEEEREHRCK